MADLNTSDTTVRADSDRTVVDENGTRRLIFAGTAVPKALADLDDAPADATKRQAAPARDKAQRAPAKDK
jgi:hypothetical protein